MNTPLDVKKQQWLRQARKQWSSFRRYFKKMMLPVDAYYPDEVYQWLRQFDKMDEIMRDFYRNA